MEKSSLTSSDVRGSGSLAVAFNLDDHISKLTNDLLLKILSKLSTKETVKTSSVSKRWINVWKEMPHVFMDMRQIVSPTAARSLTKVIMDHRGHLKSCTIYHYPYQCKDGMVESWISSLVHVKHTKHLTFVNFIDRSIPNTNFPITLDFPPQSLSHPGLESLTLDGYNLKGSQGFTNCCNIKKLKLIGVFAEIEVFNAVLLSCSSLEVAVLNIGCHKRSGSLKILNPYLKFLSLSCKNIDAIEVASLSLDIMTVGYLSCAMEKLVVANSRIQVSRNYWATGKIFPHTSYDITCPNKEEKHVAHNFLINESEEHMKRFASMSVHVDVKNIKEVNMLTEVLVTWSQEMAELEIVFKDGDATRKEGESSIRRSRKNILEETKPFLNGDFRIFIVWLVNFSGSKEEFALASRLITQGIVVRTMIIKPTSISLVSNNLKIEEAVAKLKELPKGHDGLNIVKWG